MGKDVSASLGYTKTRNAISQHVDNEDALKQGVLIIKDLFKKQF